MTLYEYTVTPRLLYFVHNVRMNLNGTHSDPAIDGGLLQSNDIANLIRHHDETVRARAAQKICRTFRDIKLSDDERRLARRLLEVMANDATEMVRRALAITLKNSPELPRELAIKLANDIDNIAVPVLANSPVFTDEDLLEILKSRAAAKVTAVAKRPTVSDHVVRAIIRYGDSHSVAELAANDGAIISERAAHEVLNIYHDDDLIKASLISRRDLPTRVAEKLITLVSEDVGLRLQARHALSVDMALDLATRSRERATIDLIDQSWKSKDLARLVGVIHNKGRLTSGLILRAGCSGQIRFVEYALACKADISRGKASLMLHDNGPFGLKALCSRASLPASAYIVLKAAISIFRDIENSGFDQTSTAFRKLMIERILTLPIDLPEAEQDYFLEKLDALDAIDT